MGSVLAKSAIYADHDVWDVEDAVNFPVQTKQNKNPRGDSSESYLAISAKGIFVLGDATEETDDLDNLSAKEGDGNIMFQTEDLAGLLQISGGSKSKRLKGDGDVSTSLSAGSVDERRRDQ
jgi:hypothetical protein